MHWINCEDEAMTEMKVGFGPKEDFTIGGHTLLYFCSYDS